jgi:hypothetical protein
MTSVVADEGVRLFNGEGTQLMTVLLPIPGSATASSRSPSRSGTGSRHGDALRARYLRIEPDPLDRTATGFSH